MSTVGALSEKTAKVERDWTKGSIVANLLSLSWPIIVSSLLLHIQPVVDMVWVGRLGAAAVAGVGVSGVVVQVANAARGGLQTGTRAMISRFIGAGDKESANIVAQQTVVISIVFAAIMAMIGIFLAEPILRLLGMRGDVVTEGVAYMRIQLVGMITMSFAMMNQSVMQASGDPVTAMKIDMGYRLLHLVLCPFLIFGWWIFPKLGVAGAALSAVITQGIGGAIGLWILYTGRTRIRLTLKGFRFDWDIMWRTVKIGIPSMLTQIQRNVGQLVVVMFIAPFGTFAVAAHALTQRIDGFLHMPASGLGQGAGILAGQNLGAGQPKRAERTGWIAAAMFTGAMTVSAIVVWLWAPNVVRIFNNEPEMIDVTSTFLRINIVTYMAFGLEMVLMNCLNGVGDTLIPLVTELGTIWALQIPLAAVLPALTGLGVYGVRAAIVTADASRAIIYAVYFRTGRWQRKKV